MTQMKKASRLSLPDRSEIILLIFMEFWRATSASWPFMFKSEVSSPRFCSNSVVQFSVGMQIYIQDLSLMMTPRPKGSTDLNMNACT